MRTLILIILIGLALLAPGTVNGQELQDTLFLNPNYATIYFYRKPEFYNGRFSCWVGKEQLISEFLSATYFWMNLPAGNYEIRTDGKPSWSIFEKRYQLKIEAGQVYYIEGVIDYDFLGTALFLKERSQEDFNQLKDKLTFDARAKRFLD